MCSIFPKGQYDHKKESQNLKQKNFRDENIFSEITFV